jgi:hypothetical protein
MVKKDLDSPSPPDLAFVKCHFLDSFSMPGAFGHLSPDPHKNLLRYIAHCTDKETEEQRA